MKRRLIASLLAVCLVAGLLPTVALAAEPCTATVGCTREAGHEGDCVLPSANNDAGEAGDEVDGEPASANDETSGMNTDTNNVPAPMDDADSNAYYETIDVIDPVDITAVESVGEQPVKIGETGYSTLADAVNAAGTNGVGTDIITLTADITLTGSIIVPEKATFTIKGEGHTIQFPAGGVFKQIDKNNLEGVTDVNLTFENVNFENTAGEKNGYAVITGFDASGVTLNFTGCTFTNMWDAVYSNVISDTNVSQNVVNITDCTFSNTAWVYGLDDGCNAAYDPAAIRNKITYNITPATTTGTEGVGERFATASITTDGVERGYATLAAAVAAVEDGGTIILLTNASGSGIGTFLNTANGAKTAVKDFTINFDNHTYTCTGPAVGSMGTQSQAFHLEWKGTGNENAKVTLKNGTISSTADSGVRMLVQNYCDLTLDNMTLDGTNIGRGQYTLSNNCGNVTIQNCEIIAPENGFAFDSCDYANYTGVSVTVKGESEILGKIERTNPNGGENNARISVQSGTFSDVSALNYLAAGADVAVELGESATQSTTIPADATVALDLNGKTLTNEDGKHTIINNGTLTITGEGTVDNVSHGKGALVNYGTAVLNGGIFKRSAETGVNATTSGGNSWYTIDNQGVMTINKGVTVENSGKFSSMIRNLGTQAGEGVTAGVLTIEGGSFTGGLNNVKNDDYSTLTVTGGTFQTGAQANIMNWNVAEINDGTFTSTAEEAVWNGVWESAGKGQLTIKGGTFTGVEPYGAVVNSEKYPGGTILITDGYFSHKPDKSYIAEGKDAVVSDKAGYYTIGVSEVDVETAVSACEPNVSVPDGTGITTDQVATAAKSEATTNTLAAAASALANDSSIVGTEDAAKTALGDLADDSATITVVVQPYLDVAVEKIETAEDGSKTMTLEIAAKYHVVATTDPDHIKTESGEGQNAVVLKEAQTLNVTTPIQITVPLASSFADGDAQFYVRHIKSSTRTYVYSATRNNDSTITFTNPNGFSTFVVTTQAPAAKIGEIGYTTLQAAVDAVQNGETITLVKDNSEAVMVGRTVTFTLDKAGKTFSGTVKGASARTTVQEENGIYTCVYSAPSGGGGSSTATYAVSTPSGVKHGSVSVSHKNASKGTAVTITVKPDSGYELDDLTVTDQSGDAVKLTKKSDTQYTFTMPASKVEITVSFVEEPALTTLPFLDVQTGDWFYDAVMFVYGEGMMNGTSSTTFSPDATTTRGMIVTILHRLAGSPASRESADFLDVPAGQYYSEAVAWASENGIVNGYDDGNFGPDDTITREQMAAILYRYAGFQGYDMSAKADLSGFSDAGTVSGYAQEAIRWANAAGLVSGTSTTTISPKAGATRAQVAAILMRFCENVVK